MIADHTQQKGQTKKRKTIRITRDTRDRIRQILFEVNQKKWGRKVKTDDVILLALGLMTEADVEALQKDSLKPRCP